MRPIHPDSKLAGASIGTLAAKLLGDLASGVRGCQIRRDLIKGFAELSTHEGDGSDDDDGNQGGDQAVFDSGHTRLAVLEFANELEHLHSPDCPAPMPALLFQELFSSTLRSLCPVTAVENQILERCLVLEAISIIARQPPCGLRDVVL